MTTLVVVNVCLFIGLESMKRQRDQWERTAYTAYDGYTNAVRIAKEIAVQRDYYMTNNSIVFVKP